MLNLTKQSYSEFPRGYCYSSHVTINIDVYETKPMVVFEEQSRIITSILMLVSDDPENDENITCKQEEEVLEYYYKGKLLMGIDSMAQEHHCMICFNYRVYGI
jgi:hypothetical protein